jgi:hypothetical protein
VTFKVAKPRRREPGLTKSHRNNASGNRTPQLTFESQTALARSWQKTDDSTVSTDWKSNSRAAGPVDGGATRSLTKKQPPLLRDFGLPSDSDRAMNHTVIGYLVATSAKRAHAHGSSPAVLFPLIISRISSTTVCLDPAKESPLILDHWIDDSSWRQRIQVSSESSWA